MRSLTVLSLAALACAEALNITALTGRHGKSVLECWRLVPDFTVSSQSGTVGAMKLDLGSLANASYSIIPGNFDAGLHNAPNVQYVVFLSGLAHITLPHSSDEAYVLGGPGGVIFAADIATVSVDGHNTNYPSTEETRALQIPTKDGKVPQHKVLHSGPCTAEESN